MLISEMIKKLEEIKEVHGDLSVYKWEQDSGHPSITDSSFQLLTNSDFSEERYATGLAIR
jgi:hypothetical protein